MTRWRCLYQLSLRQLLALPVELILRSDSLTRIVMVKKLEGHQDLDPVHNSQTPRNRMFSLHISILCDTRYRTSTTRVPLSPQLLTLTQILALDTWLQLLQWLYQSCR